MNGYYVYQYRSIHVTQYYLLQELALSEVGRRLEVRVGRQSHGVHEQKWVYDYTCSKETERARASLRQVLGLRYNTEWGPRIQHRKGRETKRHSAP